MTKDILLEYMQQHLAEFLQLFQEFVELESPSHENKEAADKCSSFLEKSFGELGFSIERIHQETCGDHIYGEIGEGEKSALLVGHYDTVFPIGTIATMPFKIEYGKAFGPGTLDMKGGIIMAYFAVKALKELGLMPEKKIGIFFNGDEESGSFYSSDLIVEKGRQYGSVLVVEPGVNELDSVKTSRYGRGTYEIIAFGTAAHSGSNAHLAVSPITEIAKQILRIEEWNEEIQGVTFAPTTLKAGIPGTCMVPETAYFTMDVRFQTKELSEKIHEKIKNLTPINPEIRLEVKGKIDKPVMEGDSELFEAMKNIARGYGIDLKGVSIGGGSDGNFTAAAGIPTLDGLGTTGEFLHNSKEYVHIDHIPCRTAMLAELIMTL